MQLSPFCLEQIQAAELRGEQRGELNGRKAGELALTLKSLHKRFGVLSEQVQGQITQLSVERLEDLAEELLDFNTVEELLGWLDRA
ncbi:MULTISPECIES: DUF4351 domain-containing protein [unclassified Chamaesiphon]|uniref:DUF4351 domain-containing protein n=1 Tax=unclassified Chamaesiphon TaxID=2620921 RepID=UPI00286B6B98|nr:MULTISPECIES: DUF4351 domain-containing protein [unclassified Chamaesiphon]